jgi:membrane protease YdiL (CAAX protease family)
MLSSFFQRIFIDTYRRSEAESQEQQNDPGTGKRTIIVCIVVALCVTMNKYFSGPGTYYTVAEFFGWGSPASISTAHLYELTWWVSVLVTFYFIIPALTIRLIFHEKLSDYGFKLKGAFKDHQLYVVMLAVMIPLVLFFSRTASFQARYPFYDVQKGESLFPHFISWEILYFLQFCGLEFFFRGFMLHGTKQRLGYYSVFVMTIPYCMIHFGKPFPETISAIIAGIVLGTLSLKSRSIWLGIAIHYSVAITMDLCALWQKGLL